MTNRFASMGLVLLAASFTVGSTGVASAQHDSGFEGGVRLGYGVPLGEPSGTATGDLNELIAGMIPIWLDLGYRASKHIFVGVYGHYGFGFVGDTVVCGGPVDCSASDIRFGAQLHYHAMPDETADLWFGAGFGYEWMTISGEVGGAEASMTLSGFELLNLQLGLDLEAARQFYVGPFVSFSIDQYDEISVDGEGVELNGDIDDKALHHWLLFGVRAAFAP